MLYSEDQLLPLSALQHLLFCERQCALIHIEQVWAENLFTVEGRVLHDRAHGGPDETRTGIRTTRGLPVRSFSLGVSGQCDVVEFHQKTGLVLPVEYKRGKPKIHCADEIQLCAQGICLEEMLGCQISHGALYYGERHKRTEVGFDETLRSQTGELAAKLHKLVASGVTPPARLETKCETCSLLNLCLPEVFEIPGGASNWFVGQLRQITKDSA